MVAKCHPICLLVFIVISKSIPERNCSLSKWRFYCIRWRANHAHRCQKLLSAQDTYQLFDKFLGNGWINIQARISQKLKLKNIFFLSQDIVYLFVHNSWFGAAFQTQAEISIKRGNFNSKCKMQSRMLLLYGETMATSVNHTTRLNHMPSGHLSKWLNALVCARELRSKSLPWKCNSS